MRRTCSATSRPIPTASTPRGARLTIARRGKREQAHEHLTTATTMYREMGMTYWREKADAER
jgi:hypothetical protein